MSEVPLPRGLPDQLGDRGLLAAGARVERPPELVVEIQLRPPHDVYYTSLGGRSWSVRVPGRPDRLACGMLPERLECLHFALYHVGMKRQAHDIQYTVRGIPREVDRALRRKAALRKLSLNQIIVEELTAGTTGVRKRADFHDIAGQWTADPAFDEIMAAQRQIDPDKWK